MAKDMTPIARELAEGATPVPDGQACDQEAPRVNPTVIERKATRVTPTVSGRACETRAPTE